MPRFLSALSESRRYYYQRSRRSINDSRDRMHFVFNNVCTARSSLSLSLSLSLCTIVTLFVQRDRHIQTSKTKLKRRVESSRVESQPETLSKLSLRLSSFCCLFSAILFSLVSPSRCERQSATPLPRRVLSTFSSFFFFCFFSVVRFLRYHVSPCYTRSCQIVLLFRNIIKA